MYSEEVALWNALSEEMKIQNNWFERIEYHSLGNFSYLNSRNVKVMQESWHSYFSAREFVECGKGYIDQNIYMIEKIVREVHPHVIVGDIMTTGAWSAVAVLHNITCISFTAFPYTQRIGDNLVWLPPPFAGWSTLMKSYDLLYRFQNLLSVFISRLLIESKFDEMYQLAQSKLDIALSSPPPHVRIALSFFGFEDAMYLPPHVFWQV